MILCPRCQHPIEYRDTQFFCNHCGEKYRKKDGIWSFISEEKSFEDYYPSDAFEKLEAREKENFWFLVRSIIIRNAVSTYLAHEANLLDIGCGTGFVAQTLKKSGFRVTCADVFMEGLLYCRTRDAGEKYCQYNCYDRLFAEEFEGICAFDILEHLEDDSKALKNCYFALKSEGYIFITVPACMGLWSIFDVSARHKRRYSRKELESKLMNAGFEIVRSSYFMSFLFPMIWISRKILSAREKDLSFSMENARKHSAREMKQNFFISRVLYAIFRFEASLLTFINFPIGSSILCIARKKKDLSTSTIEHNI